MMPLPTCLRSYILLPLLAVGIVAGGSPAAGVADAKSPERVPDPRWSMIYAIEGAPAEAPAPDIQVYGSGSQGVILADSTDIPVKPATNVTQSEISVAMHPTNPSFIFVSANATPWPVSTVWGTGVYWSTNGGTTWTGNDRGPGGVGNSGDPAAGIRASDNRMIVGYISSSGGQGASFSTDFGATWTHRTVSGAGSLDKNHLHVDNGPASPYNGNMYSAWTAFAGANSDNIEISRSTNGGDSWSPAVNISSAVGAGSHDQGVNIRTGPDGTVYAAWSIYDCWPCEEVAIGMNKSTNGGATWGTAWRAITNIKGHRNTSLPNTSIRRNSFPSMAVDVSGGANNGAVYVVWTNQGVPGVNVGDVNIYCAKSTNGGATFGTAVRVNQDAGTASQFFPWIACDPLTGQLAVVFFDRRDDATNTRARAYMAVSNDGGATWEDFPVADVSFVPTPIPGLAGGYMGDYLGIDISNGRAFPSWTDNRTGNFLTYVSPQLVSDPTDPNPPTNAVAYSDYLTPTSVALSWTDPTTYVGGDPLGNFSIDILRNDVFLVNVDQGIESFNDAGRINGQLYTYTLQTRDDVTDSLSAPVSIAAFAGGSPTPAPPTGAGCSGTTTDATITWTNPTTQSDGTPLDDFAGVRIFRNGTFLVELARAQADTGSADMYTDMPPPGFLYEYEIAAIDNEMPVHESMRASAGQCFVGDVPAILVWHPSDTGTTSADSIFAACQALGESVFLTDNLFEFSPDLNAHQVVFACVGIYSDNHIINAVEGAALDDFAQDGGCLYIEGSDCFNYDPDSAGGYNIRPIFDLNDGPDGSGDLFNLTGLNDLGGFSFAYAGGNNFIDELQPISSTPIWKNSANTDQVGVFNAGYGAGAGRGIAASWEFGGLVDVPSGPVALPATHDVSERVLPDGLAGPLHAATENHSFKERMRDTERETRPVVKKWANIGAPRPDYSARIPGGMSGALYALEAANTKIDVMAAYLMLCRATGDPVLVTSTALLTSEIFQGTTDTKFFSISNPGSLNEPLGWSLAESPAVPWLSETPTGGTIPANGSANIQVDFDASALTPGLYETDLIISSNDPVNPADTVHVALTVNGVPVVQANPTSLNVNLQPLQSTVETITVSNGGNGDLTYELSVNVTGGAARVEFASEQFPQQGSNLYRGNVYRVDIPVPLKEIEMRLNPTVSTALEFFVYEGNAATGTFTKIFSTTNVGGPGLAWYSSGQIDVALVAGKYYMIGAGWQGSTRFYSDFGVTPPLPVSVPFGAATGPAGASGYPPPGTTVVTSGTWLHSVALEYGDIFDVQILDPTSGTLPPSGSTDVDLQITADTEEGVFTGNFTIASNDPFTGVLDVPITVTVSGGVVDAPVVAVPLPTQLALHTSAPNPFRGTTEIRYDLPRPGRVTLRVFDVSGRLVRTLVDGEEPAGYRSIRWDGTDDTGARAAAGVYFYALEAQDKSFRKKVIQLR